MKPGDVKTYAEKKDITALMDEQNQNAQLIEKAKTVRVALKQRTEQLAEIPARIAAAEDSYNAAIEAAKRAMEMAEKTYKEALSVIEGERADFEARKANAESWLERYEANNPENLDTAEQLRKAEEHNRINALVVDYLTKKAQKDAAEKKASEYETMLSDLAKERETLISSAELPIAGLSFTDDGLELNGVPFVAGRVSDSQIMEVAAKLIIASNPTVKVFRICLLYTSDAADER